MEGVIQLLKNLDQYKAEGPDEIPARFLKEMADQIAPVLVLIYQATLNQGILPEDWLKAKIIPVYKKGSR